MKLIKVFFFCVKNPDKKDAAIKLKRKPKLGLKIV
jgi:hypothetical protein